MGQDVLTLQEVADLLGKSTQTIRRMIKKGDLKAQRIKTAQGFQYGIYRGQVPSTEPVIERPIKFHPDESKKWLPDETFDDLTSQVDKPMEAPVREMITSEEVDALLENDFYILQPSVDERTSWTEDLQHRLDQQHREKMLLIHILEALQVELRQERDKPKSFFAWIWAKMGF